MKSVKTFGKVINGKLKIERESEFYQNIGLMSPDKTIPVELVCKKIYPKRSVDQNAYYWGYIIKQFQKGYLELNGEPITADEAHIFLSNEFNFNELINPNTGEVKKIGKSTAILSTIEFEFYWDLCGRFISEWFGIQIDPPNTQLKVKL